MEDGIVPSGAGIRRSHSTYEISGKKIGRSDLWGSNTTKKPYRPVKQHSTAKITMFLQQAQFVRHWSRQKFVSSFVTSLIKSRNVQFGEVAQHLDDAAKSASNEMRIQDFPANFWEVNLDYLLVV